MPDINGGAVPLRQFGRHKVKISAVGFGGHHLGDAPDEPTAKRLVRQAVDGGITFFDNCWEYHRGKTEDWMGAGLKGVRDRVFLMGDAEGGGAKQQQFAAPDPIAKAANGRPARK